MAPRTEHVWSENAGRLIVASALSGLTGDDAGARTRWIHVAPYGTWKGHPSGAFALTREVFDSIVADVASRKTPIALDYEHASTQPTGGPVLASGYILRAEVRDSGLWALCELTETAAGHVRKGEIRFCSGAFKFDAKDGETGATRLCVLHSIGLTSWPFIDGQQPITLTQFVRASAPTGETSMEVDMKALAKILDLLPGPNTPEKIKKAVDAMASGEAPVVDAKPTETTSPKPTVKLTDAPAAPVTASDPMPVTAADPVADPDSDIDARLMQALGISDEGAFVALLEQKFNDIVALLSDAGASPATLSASRDAAVTALTSRVTTLTAEVNASKKREQDAAVATAIAEIDGAIAAGMVQSAQREELVTLSKASPSEARRTVSLIVASHGGAVNLTQSISTIIARAPGPPVVDEKSPAFIALTNTLRAANLKPEDTAWKNAIKTLTA